MPLKCPWSAPVLSGIDYWSAVSTTKRISRFIMKTESSSWERIVRYNDISPCPNLSLFKKNGLAPSSHLSEVKFSPKPFGISQCKLSTAKVHTANLQRNRVDFLANMPGASSQDHIPGSQAAGRLPTYQLRFFDWKQHLTLDHKQNVRKQQPAQRMGRSENWVWKQDQNLASTQQDVSMLWFRSHQWSEHAPPPFSIHGWETEFPIHENKMNAGFANGRLCRKRVGNVAPCVFT